MQTENQSIEIYSWNTPNGHKIHILCEELGINWTPIGIDISKGEQFEKEFLRISPNNKIPAMVDPKGPNNQPISLFESGAIMIYLAEKFQQFLGVNQTDRYNIIQWLMFQVGGVGPMLGQAHHFRIFAPERVEYGITRYTNEAKRLYQVIEKQLSTHTFIAGDNYSIADMAIFPWLRSWEKQGVQMSDYPAVEKWFNQIAARPAVQKGIHPLPVHP